MYGLSNVSVVAAIVTTIFSPATSTGITPAECSISRIPRSKSIDLGSYNPGHKFGGAMRKFEWTENKSIGSQHEFYAAA